MAVRDEVVQQLSLVDAHKAKRQKEIYQNSVDIRDRIAHGAHYDPKNDPIYEYHPYPKWVTPPDGKPVIVNSKQEHEELLGMKIEAKTATVDIADLAKPEVVPVKRKYTKRATATQPLPPNLD